MKAPNDASELDFLSAIQAVNATEKFSVKHPDYDDAISIFDLGLAARRAGLTVETVGSRYGLGSTFKRHTQQIISGTNGDCFRTCVASILGCESPTDVPNASETYNDTLWLQKFNIWLSGKYGLALMRLDYDHIIGFIDSPDTLLIINGPSPRFEGKSHSCVGMTKVNGNSITVEVFHDPHPDNTGLKDYTSCFVFVPAYATGAHR